MSVDDHELWQQSLARIRKEVAGLPAGEREWIAGNLARIAELQEKMQEIFIEAGGEKICGDCLGLCCDRAKYHLTLVNLLAWLLPGEEPPSPDFSRPCPFLGDSGCPFPAGRRPFNCLIFLCERVEERLGGKDRQSFGVYERQLREIYLAFDRRYAGSSLRGLLNRGARLGSRPFLDRL